MSTAYIISTKVMTSSVDRLLKNYSNARRSWEAWCFMANFVLDNPQPDIAEYIQNNELLKHLRYLAFKDFHIEMYKVIKNSKNNPDNIFALLEKLRDEDENKRDEAGKNILELRKNTNVITHICETRDKVYAHLDKDFESSSRIGLPIHMALDCFIAVENSIMTLTSRETLMSYLDDIASKNDLHL